MYRYGSIYCECVCIYSLYIYICIYIHTQHNDCIYIYIYIHYIYTQIYTFFLSHKHTHSKNNITRVMKKATFCLIPGPLVKNYFCSTNLFLSLFFYFEDLFAILLEYLPHSEQNTFSIDAIIFFCKKSHPTYE